MRTVPRGITGAREPVGVILPIQYLRGIAALMVVWHHSSSQIPALNRFFPGSSGAHGVDLFFVISGFIMAVTTTGAGLTPLQFLRRRVVRVVPLYWILTLAMVGLALVAPSLFRTLKVTADTLVQSLLFIPHFSTSFTDKAWPLLVPGWTLNYEMYFYVILAVILLLPAAWRMSTLAAFFGISVVAGWLLGPMQSAAG